MDANNVVQRFLGSNVIPFRARTSVEGVPTVRIGNKTYVLSTDGGPLGDREDDEDLERAPAPLPSPSANKWRYLWALDTDKQVVAMWRARDGSEKVWSPAVDEQVTLAKLLSAGQLNRVRTAEFLRIHTYMTQVDLETTQALRKIAEESKDPIERAIARELHAFYEREKPVLARQVAAVLAGVIPIGFHPHSAERLTQQALSHVIGQFFARTLSASAALKVVVDKVAGFDVTEHTQDVVWGLDDLRDRAYEEFLPPRE